MADNMLNAPRGPMPTGNWMRYQKAGQQGMGGGGMAQAGVITSGIGNMLGDISTILDKVEEKRDAASLSGMAPYNQDGSPNPDYMAKLSTVMARHGSQGALMAAQMIGNMQHNYQQSQIAKTKAMQHAQDKEADLLKGGFVPVKPGETEQGVVNQPVLPGAQGPTEMSTQVPVKPQITSELGTPMRWGGKSKETDTTSLRTKLATTTVPFTGQVLNKGERVVDLADPKFGLPKEISNIGKVVVGKQEELKPIDQHRLVLEQQADEKAVRTGGEKIVGIGGGANGRQGLNLRRYDQSDNMLMLIDAMDSGIITPTSEQATLLATGIASMVTNGSRPARELIQDLAYKYAGGDVNKFYQYLSGNPKKYLTHDILTLMRTEMEREHDIWSGKLDENVKAEYDLLTPIFSRDMMKNKGRSPLRDSFLSAMGHSKFSNPGDVQGSTNTNVNNAGTPAPNPMKNFIDKYKE